MFGLNRRGMCMMYKSPSGSWVRLLLTLKRVFLVKAEQFVDLTVVGNEGTIVSGSLSCGWWSQHVFIASLLAVMSLTLGWCLQRGNGHSTSRVLFICPRDRFDWEQLSGFNPVEVVPLLCVIADQTAVLCYGDAVQPAYVGRKIPYSRFPRIRGCCFGFRELAVANILNSIFDWFQSLKSDDRWQSWLDSGFQQRTRKIFEMTQPFDAGSRHSSGFRC